MIIELNFTLFSTNSGFFFFQTLHISNIFHEEKNFRWMYLFVRQVLRIKNVEESLFYGHLIDALGKALSAMDEVWADDWTVPTDISLNTVDDWRFSRFVFSVSIGQRSNGESKEGSWIPRHTLTDESCVFIEDDASLDPTANLGGG